MPRTLDPQRAALLGRIGAHVTHSKNDPRETTARARATFLGSFEQQVDPDGVLPPEERARRAEHARKAHFARLALLSVEARSTKRAPARRPQGAGVGAAVS